MGYRRVLFFSKVAQGWGPDAAIRYSLYPGGKATNFTLSYGWAANFTLR